MKKAVIITSCIEVDNNYPLTYSNLRAAHNTDQRYQQTLETLYNCMCNFDKDTHYFLVDVSLNPEQFEQGFNFVPNFHFIKIKDEFPEILESVRTHPNKTYCETTFLGLFLEKYKDQLLEFDFFIKLSGRYQISDNFDVKFFNRNTPRGFYVKEKLEWEWFDVWKYDLVDRRTLQNNNKLYQYCTVIYGWSKEYFNSNIEILKEMSRICGVEWGLKYDMETLLYFLTRPYEDNVYEQPWVIEGLIGTNGQLQKY